MNHGVSTDTWGISGRTFLLWYCVVVAIVFAVVLLARRAMRRRVATQDESHGVPDDPYLIAYLNGGAHLAVLSALASLHADGLVTSLRGRCTQLKLRTKASIKHRPALDRKVFDELLQPRSVEALVSEPPVTKALYRLHAELTERYLLLSESDMRFCRRLGYLPLALCALGVVRLFTGMFALKPIGYLVLVLLPVIIGTVLLFGLAPAQHTNSGEHELDRLKTRYAHLNPTMNPDWTAHGSNAAALCVAVSGAAALKAAAPIFASDLFTSNYRSANRRRSPLGGAGQTGSSYLAGGFSGFSGAGCGGGSGCAGGGGSSCGGGGGCGGASGCAGGGGSSCGGGGGCGG